MKILQSQWVRVKKRKKFLLGRRDTHSGHHQVYSDSVHGQSCKRWGMTDTQEDNKGEVFKKMTREEEDLMRDSKSSCHPLSIARGHQEGVFRWSHRRPQGGLGKTIDTPMDVISCLCFFWIQVGVREGLTDILGQLYLQ